MLHHLIPGVQSLPKLFSELHLISSFLVADAEGGGGVLGLALSLEGLFKLLLLVEEAGSVRL
jgi:hypothetical protein